jgi:hypothetical protein
MQIRTLAALAAVAITAAQAVADTIPITGTVDLAAPAREFRHRIAAGTSPEFHYTVKNNGATVTNLSTYADEARLFLATSWTSTVVLASDPGTITGSTAVVRLGPSETSSNFTAMASLVLYQSNVAWRAFRGQIQIQGSPGTMPGTTNEWTSAVNIAAHTWLGTFPLSVIPPGAGYGDMLTSIYDGDTNGIVDNAEAVGGIPAGSVTTNGHTHAGTDITSGTIPTNQFDALTDLGGDSSTGPTNEFLTKRGTWRAMSNETGTVSWPSGRSPGVNYFLGSAGTNAVWWTAAAALNVLQWPAASASGGDLTNKVVFASSGTTTQSWIVAVGCTNIQVKLWGAGGGGATSAVGGYGGFVVGFLKVTPLETLSIKVGKGGGTSYLTSAPYTAPGGLPGGGDGDSNDATSGNSGGGGGGYTAILRGTNVLLLAAGGGGAGLSAAGGYGGDKTGATGATNLGTAGTGGSQSAGGTSGGALLTGGDSGAVGTGSLGGGGAGYYGGGGATTSGGTKSAGGGGGSNYDPSGYATGERGNNEIDTDWSATVGRGSAVGNIGSDGQLVIYY